MTYKPSSLSHRVSRSYKTQARLRPRVIQQPATDPNWYVVMTNPRCELRAKGGLEALGYPTFLPVLAKWRRKAKNQGGGRERVEYPLFPRYLFVGLDPRIHPFYPIRLTDGVAGIITNNGAPVEIPRGIIRKLVTEQERGDHDETLKAAERLAGLLGQSVEVTDPLFGTFRATVTKVAGDKVYGEAEVKLLGKPIKLKMPIAELEEV